ncbi:unnamed protein product [Diplocarpon coronariae]|uniref:N-acetyltransferase domain-containing protein n=1 Tax=Diplocarpon coronariae TaxID=2795749 RepID=A0A218Z4U8_9HELO|nr:hypothetical protein B2J93_4396 [Marssonina coronariae]
MDILTPTLPSLNITTTTISRASIADLPVLAQIATSSQLPEAIMPFFFAAWPETTHMLAFYTARVRAKLLDPCSVFFKMTDDASGQIVGIVCVTRERGDAVVEKVLTTTAHEEGAAPLEGFNYDFARDVFGGLEGLIGFMKEREHYMLSSLAVRRAYQKRGLGRRLMMRCHELATEDGLPIYLTAFPSAHDMYLKLGYTDETHFDVDLNEYGTKYRGFGVYRSYGMLWQPENLRGAE